MTPSEVDFASARATGAQNLLADAKRRRMLAATARLDAEHAAAKLALAVDAATQASRDARENAQLAQNLGHCRTQLEHAQSDLRAAIEADAAAALAVEEAESALADAQRGVEREQLGRELAGPAYAEASKEDAEAIVASILEVRDRIAAIRARTEAENALTRRYHELGGAVAVRPRDGSTAAGFLLGALARAGGRVGAPEAIMEARWCLDLPTPSSPIYHPNAAAKQLASFIASCLEQGARDKAAGMAERGVRALEDAEKLWVHARDFVGVMAATEMFERGRAQVLADEHRAAHEKRLQLAHDEHLRRAGRSVGPGGRPITAAGVPQHRPIPVATDAASVRERLARERVARGEPADLGGEALSGSEGAFIPEGSVEGLSIDAVAPAPAPAPAPPPRRLRTTAPRGRSADTAPVDLGGEVLSGGEGAFIPDGSVEGLDPTGGIG